MITVIGPYSGSGLSECWFGFYSAHSCIYDSLHPTVYFSLGEAVGAVGLFIAVYQLRKPAWRMIYEIRNWRWISYTLLILGILAIGISAFISQVPIYLLKPPYNYPLFYELLGYVFFILAPISFFFLSITGRWLFNKWTYERFFQTILRGVARLTPETLESAIDIIALNLPKLAELTKKNEAFSFFRSPTPEEIEEAKTPERQQLIYAEATIDTILSEKKVATYIATGRLDFLLYFLDEIRKKDLTQTSIRWSSQALLKVLYQNKDSHLYSQLEYGGLSYAANLYQTLFYDQKVLSNTDAFSTWNSYLLDDDSILLEEKYLEVYLKALENGIKGYWVSSRGFRSSDPFYDGFDNLDNYVSKVISLAYKDKTKKEAIFGLLNKVADFVGRTFVHMYTDAIQNNQVPESEINVEHQRDYLRGTSLMGYYTHFLYNFLENISKIYPDEKAGLKEIESDEDIIRLLAYHSTHEILMDRSSSPAFTKVRNDLIAQIWEKIEENMNGYYPAVLRIYIISMLYRNGGSEYTRERNKLIRYLETELKPKILNGEKMVNDELMEDVLLPRKVKLNRSTGNFQATDNGGTTTDLTILPVVTVEAN